MTKMFLVLVANAIVLSSVFGFSTEKLQFTVKFKEEISSYRVLGVFVLPEEKLNIEIIEGADQGKHFLSVSSGTVISTDNTNWQWQAPTEKGLHPIMIINPAGTDTMLLNVFVMVPYTELKGEYLNKYRIGKYPTKTYKQLPVYKTPGGFIEITKDNKEALVSPHFRLQQFKCKQGGNYPKYVVLRERMVLKLELILEKVNNKGYRCETFNIMSGYRTPYYNEAIRDVKYSRHIYGDASDIFIDANPKNGMMDDLNKDGTINNKDAMVLYMVIDNMYGEPWFDGFIGGLGMYGTTAAHGPFVHVDTRGFKARW
ncbi:hypothetical protein KAS45_04250 [candidate division WOR-3 bacterium]|nr:hypothetical protein [candidate division WOR-3 bacterium]